MKRRTRWSTCLDPDPMSESARCGARNVRCVGCNRAVSSTLDECPRCHGAVEPSRCRRLVRAVGLRCRWHGGGAPQVQRAAERRAILDGASRLGLLEGRIVDDPIEELMRLAGEALALVDALKHHVAELERVGTTSGRYGETVKPEIAAYLEAIGRAERILTSLTRLGLAERFVKLDEARVEIVVKVLERVLAACGLNPQAQDVRAHVARELTLVAKTE